MIEIYAKTVYDSVEDLGYNLADNLTHDQLFELIVILDKIPEDWGFTKKVYKHFSEEMKLFGEQSKDIL
jgi:hypothetical protein